MHFHSCSSVGISAILLALSVASAFASAESQQRKTASIFETGVRRKPVSSECVIQAAVKLAIDPQAKTDDDDDDDEFFECELDPSETGGVSGLSVPIELDVNQKKEFKDKLHRGELVSNESTILFQNSGIKVGNGKVMVPRGRKVALGKKKNTSHSRRLSDVFGTKPMLVVKVTDSAGKARNESPAQMSDDIFGTDSDPVNLKSQMYGCSFGQLDIIAGDPPTNSAGNNEVAAGVIEVNINIPLSGNTRGTIRNAVTTAAQNKLGFTLPGPYEQVMYILEGCYHTDCGWAAYAYINSWNSVYQGPYYYMTGVQMHEIGHNFGFAHSGGLDGQTYTDHTGMMGNPLYSDDVGKMCWNAAKTWQIGWYDSNKLIFDQQGSWSGKIVGIADYGNNPANHPVVIKLETGTSTDFFVNFNRATGVNSQNDEADDEVTIVQAGNNGEAYSQSYLKAHLVQGESYQFSNWRGSGQTLTITAHEINIAANPGYADISICLGACGTNAPTASPTARPTAPTPSPTSAPPCVDDPEGWYDSDGPTYDCAWYAVGTNCASYGDFYENFGKTANEACCACGGGKTPDEPTASPNVSPTASPTVSPTASPTVSPTASPTASPSASPTASPTESPTETDDDDVAGCPAGQALLQVEVRTDANGADQNKFVVKSKNANGKLRNVEWREEDFDNNSVETFVMCLPINKCYKFFMWDSARDGMCCEAGEGGYTVTWDGSLLKDTKFKNGRRNTTPLFGTC